MPPVAMMKVAFLPMIRPFGFPSAYEKVLPTRAIWSIQSLSTEGIPKLCIGTPKTYSSACSSSASKESESESNSFCCGVRAASDRNPKLEHRRDPEVVHRHAEDVFIGLLEFGEQGIRKRKQLLLLWSACRFRSESKA